MKYLCLLFGFIIILFLFNCSNKKAVIEPKDLVADFTFEIGEKGRVTFINKSFNAEQFYWDFGDSLGTSIEKNPQYTFPFSTNFQVTLKVKNAIEEKEITKKVEFKSTNEPIYTCDDNMVGLNFDNKTFCAKKDYLEYQMVDTGKKNIESRIWLDNNLDNSITDLFLGFKTNYILGESVNLGLMNFGSEDFNPKVLNDSTIILSVTYKFYAPVNGWIKVTKVEGNKVSGELAFIVYLEKIKTINTTYLNSVIIKDEVINVVPENREKILIKGTFKNLQNRNKK